MSRPPVEATRRRRLLVTSALVVAALVAGLVTVVLARRPDPPTAAPADVRAAAGFAQYEVSAYAQPDRQCAHNLNYWRFGDYLGIGAGAHGKLSFPDRIVRQVRWREPAAYMAHAAAARVAAPQWSKEDMFVVWR